MSIYVAVIDGMTSHDAADITRLETILFSQEGVVGVTGDDLLVEAQASPDMTVQVNPGSCFVLRDANAANDNTLRFWHVVVTATNNVTIPAADPSNPRIDLICVKIDTGATPDATASNVATLVDVEGTAAASPTAPAVPNNHLKLAEVSVPALDTTISSGQITDYRTFIGIQLPYAHGYRLKDTAGNLNSQIYEDSSGNLIMRSARSGGAVKIDMATNSIMTKGKEGDTYAAVATQGQLATASSPTPTTEGLAQWDSDDDRLVVGNGSTQVKFEAIGNQQIDIVAVLDGGGSALTTGVKLDIEVPFACTINRATLLADQSGSIVIDIWKDTYANYPPTDADSITASAPPTLSTAIKAQDTTLTGWTTAIAAGDVLRFNIDSITTCTRVTLALRVTRT